MPPTPEYYDGDLLPPLAITELRGDTPVTSGGPTALVVRPGLSSLTRTLAPSNGVWLLNWQAGDLANATGRWVEYRIYVQPQTGETAPQPVRLKVNPRPS